MKTFLSIRLPECQIKYLMLIGSIGCISAIYASSTLVGVLYLLGNYTFLSDLLSDLYPWVPFAAISFGLTSMFFWHRLIRLRQQLTVRRGSIVGLQSALTAHPVMFMLQALLGIIASFLSSPIHIDALYVLLWPFVGVALEIDLFWWLILLTLALGALGGGVATALILGIRSRKQHL